VLSLVPYIVGFVGVMLLGRLLKEDSRPDLGELAVPVGIAVGAQWLARWAGLQWVGAGSMHVAFLVAAMAAIVLVCFIGVQWRREFSSRLAVVAVAMFGCILAAAGYLDHRRSQQRLSKPAVKLEAQPVFMVDEKGSNKLKVAEQRISFPAEVLNFRSEEYPLQKAVYDWLPKDTTYGQRIYTASSDGFEIQVMGLLMGSDRSAIHKPQHCLRGQGWTIVSQEPDQIRINGPQPFDLPVMKIRFRMQVPDGKGGVQDRGGVFVYWFISEHNKSADDSQRMWQFAWNLLRTGEVERWASIMHVAYPPPGLEDVAYDRIKAFIQASVPEYHVNFGTRESRPVEQRAAVH
jgi:hypothetical protein